MKRTLNRFVVHLSIPLLLLNACMPAQTITKRYRSWGEEILLSAPESKIQLHLRLSLPKQPAFAPACILIVHGMNEYVGRYANIARFFSAKYIVAGVDLRGHGLTNPVLFEADRAIANGVGSVDAGAAFLAQSELHDLGPMRQDLNAALEYLQRICAQTAGQHPKPIFLLTHSLGSLVAASYLQNADPENKLRKRVAGIILSGPAFSVTRIPGWRGWFQNPFIRFSFHTHEHFLYPHDEPWPIMALNQIISFLTVPLQDGIIGALSLPGMRIIFSPKTPEWVVGYLSDWEQEKQRHRADQYIIRQTQLNFALGIEKEIIAFRRSMVNFDTPYLLIYSAGDPITPAWGNRDFIKATLQNHSHNEVLELQDKSHHEQLFSAPPLNRLLLQKIDAWIVRNPMMPQAIPEVLNQK